MGIGAAVAQGLDFGLDSLIGAEHVNRAASLFGQQDQVVLDRGVGGGAFDAAVPARDGLSGGGHGRCVLGVVEDDGVQLLLGFQFAQVNRLIGWTIDILRGLPLHAQQA